MSRPKEIKILAISYEKPEKKYENVQEYLRTGNAGSDEAQASNAVQTRTEHYIVRGNIAPNNTSGITIGPGYSDMELHIDRDAR